MSWILYDSRANTTLHIHRTHRRRRDPVHMADSDLRCQSNHDPVLTLYLKQDLHPKITKPGQRWKYPHDTSHTSALYSQRPCIPLAKTYLAALEISSRADDLTKPSIGTVLLLTPIPQFEGRVKQQKFKDLGCIMQKIRSKFFYGKIMSFELTRINCLARGAILQPFLWLLKRIPDELVEIRGLGRASKLHSTGHRLQLCEWCVIRGWLYNQRYKSTASWFEPQDSWCDLGSSKNAPGASITDLNIQDIQNFGLKKGSYLFFVETTHGRLFSSRYAHELLTNFMESQGFKVTRHYLGLETAWRAEYAQGKGGRVLGINSEMDALPGIGHGCGHNLIAIGGVGVALALKAVLQANPKIPGNIILLGTPGNASSSLDRSGSLIFGLQRKKQEVVKLFSSIEGDITKWMRALCLSHISLRQSKIDFGMIGAILRQVLGIQLQQDPRQLFSELLSNIMATGRFILGFLLLALGVVDWFSEVRTLVLPRGTDKLWPLSVVIWFFRHQGRNQCIGRSFPCIFEHIDAATADKTGSSCSWRDRG